MLHPKFTAPFTRDIYDAIDREIARLEDMEGEIVAGVSQQVAIPVKLSDRDQHRLDKLKRWRGYLEDDASFVEMGITKFPPDGPIRL